MNECIVHINNSQITNKAAIRKFFAELKDGRHLLKAERINKRTNLQNRYLHGVIIPLVFKGLRDMGFDDVRDEYDAKLVIKSLFLKRKVSNGSETIDVIRKTSQLTTVEMIEFIDEVIKWSSEYLSVTIPMPGEQTSLFLASYDNEVNATIVK